MVSFPGICPKLFKQNIYRWCIRSWNVDNKCTCFLPVHKLTAQGAGLLQSPTLSYIQTTFFGKYVFGLSFYEKNQLTVIKRNLSFNIC